MSNQRLIGQTVGKYKIVELLGRGGMAEVYKAYQETLDRHVAIKLMHSFLADEEDFLSRFQREARAMAALSHTHIVSVYDFDVQDGTYYIVMEFVNGGTLKQSLEGMASLGERLPLSQTVQIVLEIADALAYAHSRSMVHRDIKPANIMLDGEGRAILTDFGIAKILSGPSFTATGAMIGTPAYMSPEQGLGQPGDERSDLYALGVLFFQMATGSLPYDADTPLAVILKHVNEPIPEPASLDVDIPDAIHQVILKAMAKNPEERYQTANALANDLRAAVRVSNLGAAAAIPASLLRDKPTPPPMKTAQSPTPSGLAPTMLPAQPTQVGAGETRISSANLVDQTSVAAPPAPPKKRSRTPFFIIGVIVLLVLGAIGGSMVLANRGNENATPTNSAVVADETDTPEPTETEESPTSTVEERTPLPTADIGATAAAAVAQALTAQPSDTPLPSPTIASTSTPTPDMTATALASCEVDVELVNVYTFGNPNFQSAPVGTNFTINWVVENNGTCPIAPDLFWAYVDGEEFGQDGPVEVAEEILPGEEATISTSLTAPLQPRTYESTWQLTDAEGELLGSPQSFEILVYVPETPTPVLPTQTPTPAVTATPSSPLSFSISVFNCSYAGTEWVCTLSVNVSGGVGPYTVSITDADPPSTYSGAGPSFSHTIQSRRCFNWNQSITVQDSLGDSVTQGFSIDPDNYFEGGCLDSDPPT